MKTLIIAEKPSAGKDIAKALEISGQQKGFIENDKYIVTWARGHLVGLREPDEADERYHKWKLQDLPLPTDNGLKVFKESREQFNLIKMLISRSDVDRIINAGDAGREGLLIQSWIYRMAGNKKPVDILWASSLTNDAIIKAMNNLHSSTEPEFVNLLREAETRAEADLKYGLNYSRMLTLIFAEQGVTLSYGRCQTPLLNLISIRDKEIENFKPQPYWTISAEYAEGFSSIMINEETGKTQRFTDLNDAKKIVNKLQGARGIVTKYSSLDKQEKAPALLNLSELQSIMGKKYGITPDQTLQTAQQLYEKHKILSYPRTDSRYLSDDLFGEITEHLNSCRFGKFAEHISAIDYENIVMDKTYFNNNKVSDHHALIPTINPDIASIYEKLSETEQHCFDEVVISLVAIFLPSYQYKSTDITIDIDGNIFKATGNCVKDRGYKAAYAALKSKKNEKEEELLPELTEEAKLEVVNVSLKEDKTKPPVRYGPGNIIKLMNKYKIGTPATAAEIIKKLEKRGFIKLESGKYTATHLGRNFIKIVPEVLKTPMLTMQFEEDLSRVNSKELSKEAFLAAIDTKVKEHLEMFQGQQQEQKLSGGDNASMKCPLCGEKMFLGKTKSGKTNWYCSGYKKEVPCNFRVWQEISGKKLTETQVSELINKRKTSLIKGFTAKNGNKFDAYIVLKDGALGFEFPAIKKKQMR